MKNTLVTGGAGFIGSHLVDYLINHGHNVTVIDNETSDPGEEYYWNNNAKNYNFDICNYEKTRKLYDGIDTVFHLAGQNKIQKSLINPEEAIRVNGLGTGVVLKASLEAGVSRVIYSSSSSVYGNGELPNIETQIPQCLNPYSLSKYAGEQLCKAYYDNYGLESIVLRYFNVYGDRQRACSEYSPVISTFMRQKRDGLPLTIVGDGTQRRDFTNVMDVVAANILAATAEIPKDLFATPFNIAPGNSYSINEVAEMISDWAVRVPRRKSEIKETLADNAKAKMFLGWEPRYNLSDWVKERI